MKENYNKLVSDIMVTDVKSLHRKKALVMADNIFSEHNFHHLVIVEENGDLCGILSKSDVDNVKHFSTLLGLKKAELYNSRILGSLLVEDIMQSNVFTVDSRTHIRIVLNCFLENQFHALPVVDDGKLVGIITQHDLLKLMKGMI